MKRRTLMIAVAMFTMGLTPSILAQQVARPSAGLPGEWQAIGTIRASRTLDHDSIIVRGPFDNFRRIKFRVTEAPLNIHRLVVTYDNGAPDRIVTRYNIPQGGESREIDLRGVGTRSIRRIDFWYDTKGMSRARAEVTVFGMK